MTVRSRPSCSAASTPCSAACITASAVAKVDSTHYTVSFPSQSAAGAYSLSVGPNILDLAGNPYLVGTTTSFTVTAPARIALMNEKTPSCTDE